MMLAYRRGLLEPDYKHGVQSMIREKLIMDMLADEISAEAIKISTVLRCISLAPALKPETAIDFVDSLRPSVLRYMYLSEYDRSAPSDENIAKEELSQSSVGLSKAFNMLKERGIIEEFKERVAQAFKDLDEETSE